MAQNTATPDSTDTLSVEEIVEQLTTAGPDRSGQLLTEGQAAAFAHRDVLGHNRQETADALGVSKSAVDNRLAGARRNARAAADLVRLMDRLGAYDDGPAARTLDELREEIEIEADDELDDDQEDDHSPDTAVLLSRLDQLSEQVEELSAQQERQQAATDAAAESASDGSDETADGSAQTWGRLMALSEVTNVSRSRGTVAVALDEPTDDVIEEVRDLLSELGYAIWSVEDGADRVKVRGRGAESEEPAPEPRDLDEDLVSVVERKPHVCKSCGRGFASGGALGGHRRYCRMRTDR